MCDDTTRQPRGEGVPAFLPRWTRGVTIVGNLGTQQRQQQRCLPPLPPPCPPSPSPPPLTVGPNPPISLRERGSGGERRHCGWRQCSRKRSVQYQIEVAARQWLPFTGPFTRGLHTALSNASFFSSSPLLCSVLSPVGSLFSPRRPFFSSSQRDQGLAGWGGSG